MKLQRDDVEVLQTGPKGGIASCHSRVLLAIAEHLDLLPEVEPKFKVRDCVRGISSDHLYLVRGYTDGGLLRVVYVSDNGEVQTYEFVEDSVKLAVSAN